MALIDALSDYLLELHQRSGEFDHREQQRHVFERLRCVIPLDAGLLAYGRILDGVPSATDAWLFDRPMALMESWAQVNQQDRVALTALAQPGRTFNFDVEGPIFEGQEEARAHCRRWGLAQVLCTAARSDIVGLFSVLSVYRQDPKHPFTEEERQWVEWAAPHVFASIRRARLELLRRTAWVPTRTGQCAAIVGDDGVVLEADPNFAALMREAWPQWVGPRLPDALWPSHQEPRANALRPGNLVLRLDRTGGSWLLSVRRAVIADALTDREREIAQAFSLGETYKALGARFAISPNTVRRHLANIYEKLGISSKVELDRMISGVE